MYQKLKGIVRDSTLIKILHEEAYNVTHLPKENKMIFHTRQSIFAAVKKDEKYWWIFQILGEVDLGEVEADV